MLTWSFEIVERLTDLYAEGHRTDPIAAVLSKEFGIHITKNMVIGKIRRLGLPEPERKRPRRPADRNGAVTGRTQSKTPNPGTRPKSGKKIGKRSKVPGEGGDYHGFPAEEHRAKKAVLNATGGIPALIKEKRPAVGAECRWPYGEPGTASFRQCGRASLPRKPYCKDHQKLATGR